MRRTFLLLLVMLTLLPLTGTASPDELANLRQENAELRSRVEKLESALAEIRSMLKAKETAAAAPAAPAAPAAQPAPAPAAEPVAMKSKFGVTFYGYVKLDAARDDGRVNPGNFARWVERQPNGYHDPEFNMTMNETRFGFDVAGPALLNSKTSAKIEFDLMGGGAENKPNPMLRHAYFQMEWPAQQITLLAGQSSDLISPIGPTMLNYSSTWWGGNMGYRHPQIRFTKGFKTGEASRLDFQVAATRTIGDAGNFTPGDSGEDTGWPSIQSRIAATFPVTEGQKATFGISGHYGEEEYDTNAAGAFHTFPSWSANADLNLPLQKWLLLRAELFHGANLDDYFGGVSQGVNLTAWRAIRSTGGWISATLGPWSGWRFNGGVSVDDPYNSDLGTAYRSRNSVVFGNTFIDISKAVQFGFELSHWKTAYQNAEKARAIRAQTSLIYRF